MKAGCSSHIQRGSLALPSDVSGQCEKPRRVGLATDTDSCAFSFSITQVSRGIRLTNLNTPMCNTLRKVRYRLQFALSIMTVALCCTLNSCSDDDPLKDGGNVRLKSMITPGDYNE